MQSGYKRLGNYIRLVDERNRNLEVNVLLGVSVKKKFIKSIANTNGTDFTKYKIVKKNQFTYIPDTSRRGDKIGIALLKQEEIALVYQAYSVFKVSDLNKLLPDYLMMWFRRPEFDRYARVKSHGSVREMFDWNEMCDIELPIPSVEKQKELIAEYEVIENRIQLNKKLCATLEETAQTIYKHWFEDFEFPVQSKLDPELVEGYKSSGGEMVECEDLKKKIPKGWRVGKLGEVSTLKYGKMLDAEKFLKTGFPVFSGYGIRGYYTEYLYEEPQILVLCRGVSGTGEVKMSPPFAYITNLSIVVEVKTENNNIIKKAFLLNYLKNENLRKLDSGSAQSQITIGDLEVYKVLLPEIKVLNEFEKMNSAIFSKHNKLLETIQKLEELKSLLLGKMAVEE